MEFKEILKGMELETVGDIVELMLLVSKKLDRLDQENEHVIRTKSVCDAVFFGLHSIVDEIKNKYSSILSEKEGGNKVLNLSDKIELKNNVK